jgi:hypothetical protein
MACGANNKEFIQDAYMLNCKQTMIIYVKYIQLKRDNRN